MNKKLTGLIACLALLLPQFARAEGCVWMGYYPGLSDDGRTGLHVPSGATASKCGATYGTDGDDRYRFRCFPPLRRVSVLPRPAAVERGPPSPPWPRDILDSKSDYGNIQLAGSEPRGFT
jgi:hypothetical protein